jgi:serine phosphatase RsbU (regulator of sigma subunit)
VLHRNAEVSGMRARTVGPEMPALAARMGFASHVTVPITAPVRGTVLGTISLVKGAERDAFTDAEVRTALDIGRRAGLAVDNTRMYGEQRHVAEVLQQSLLTDLPTAPGLELHARYQPAASGSEVGGDWYDAFVQPDGDLIATIGDAAGHDIEAAAAMGQLRNLIRGNAYGRPDRVGELMAHLDEAIRGLRIRTPATAILARVHRDGDVRRLSWTNAGHPPPMVLRADGEVEVLDRQPESLLGLTWGATRRSTHETALEPGATLLLYTDGLVERRGSYLDDGIAELRDRLRAAADLPAGELCDALLRQADSREDDIALLAIRTMVP